ncbi:MAG: transposase [Candidatus Omnitrophica bacterium]|nr:transposase [Candidatus Omnitrophota bacterium]
MQILGLKSTNPLERINKQLRKITTQIRLFSESTQAGLFIYLVLKEEGVIIDRGFEDVPIQKQKNASLEFANKY